MKNKTMGLVYLQAFLIFVFLLFAIAFPWLTIKSVMIGFGALLIIEGIFAFIKGITQAGVYKGFFLFFIYGLISLIAGFGILASPELSLITLGYLLAGWILVSGLINIVDGLLTVNRTTGIFRLISGSLSLILAFVIFFFPADSAVEFMWFVGIYLALWLIFSWPYTTKPTKSKKKKAK